MVCHYRDYCLRVIHVVGTYSYIASLSHKVQMTKNMQKKNKSMGRVRHGVSRHIRSYNIMPTGKEVCDPPLCICIADDVDLCKLRKTLFNI